MSGYLEVKYPFRSNLGLNPFKAWKRQWCILRPSPISVGGGSLVFYCNEGGDPAGSVDIPVGSVVKKAKSRSRPYAFAVFLADEPMKPKILLAAHSTNEAKNWMDKIRIILEMNSLDTEIPVKDSYFVTMMDSELSRKLSLSDADGSLSITPTGLVMSKQSQLGTLVHWEHVKAVSLEDGPNKNKICVIRLDWLEGGGYLRVSSPVSAELARRLRNILDSRSPNIVSNTQTYHDNIDVQASTFPSSVCDVDVTDGLDPQTRSYSNVNNDSITSRRSEISLVSLASGIYEEIPDLPLAHNTDNMDELVNALPTQESLPALVGERTYEAVVDLHCTAYPPPLPPRTPFSNVKLGESWSSRLNQISSSSRHGSLCSLPSDPRYKTLPKDKRPFTMFRKRLKSDPSTKPTKENDETKKKKFDITQTAVFKNFRVGKKLKNSKTNNLNRVTESKSCEFLDEVGNRCSKSIESLESDELDCTDLSIESNDDVLASLTLPQEIVDLILRSKKTEKKVQVIEGDYMPMSPIIPPDPIENHYIVMSPRTKTI